jgi:hypothetical protein
MSMDLYGSLTQPQLVHYFFVRNTASNQSRNLLFTPGQGDRLRGAFSSLLLCELGLHMAKQVCAQSKQAVAEYPILFTNTSNSVSPKRVPAVTLISVARRRRGIPGR